MAKKVGRRIIHYSPSILYSFASILWIIAGVNILRIAVVSWSTSHHLLAEYIWLIVSLIFFSIIIFPKVVRENISYVKSCNKDKLHLFKCMKPKAWVIMIVMISFGIALRYSGWVPSYFIAGFYAGLGISLIVSIWPYFREVFRNK